MAKVHLNLYYLEVQNQYFEMLENLKEFKELATQGVIDQAEYNKVLREVEQLKSNYERLSYEMFLLNKPSDKNSKKRSVNQDWYSQLQGASKEAVIDENADVLADLKKYIKEGKDRLDG